MAAARLDVSRKSSEMCRTGVPRQRAARETRPSR
jgi:hypothetical protein